MIVIFLSVCSNYSRLTEFYEIDQNNNQYFSLGQRRYFKSKLLELGSAMTMTTYIFRNYSLVLSFIHCALILKASKDMEAKIFHHTFDYVF